MTEMKLNEPISILDEILEPLSSAGTRTKTTTIFIHTIQVQRRNETRKETIENEIIEVSIYHTSE